jgi:hypothetical protein
MNNLNNDTEIYYESIMAIIRQPLPTTTNEIFDQVRRWVDIHLQYTPIPLQEWGENLPKIECCICFENKDKPDCISLNCSHTLCSECTPTLITNHSNNCPLCRTKITQLEVYSQEVECMIQREEIRIYKLYYDRH